MNEKFREYMNKHCPGWEQKDLEVVNEALNVFTEWEKWKEIQKDTLNKALNQNVAGLDYTTDYNRAISNSTRCQTQLDAIINGKLNDNAQVQLEEEQITK